MRKKQTNQNLIPRYLLKRYLRKVLIQRFKALCSCLYCTTVLSQSNHRHLSFYFHFNQHTHGNILILLLRPNVEVLISDCVVYCMYSVGSTVYKTWILGFIEHNEPCDPQIYSESLEGVYHQSENSFFLHNIFLRSVTLR